ncbi:MAG TPA: argininosuccinate synthase [Syntrophorhabdaceae bacterium]|nr:argininosuccinate synthase [Syntrophorhabdaceae bacterium]HQM82808.1 argininosuccinate synthase [Syntrophorhabdaceae bacterium]
MMGEIKKVVLAYSGGLDTSIIVKWLKEQYGCEVIAYAADVGQAEELAGLEEKAIKTGASKVYIEDLREEFARDFIFFAIKANAVYEGGYLMGTSIARPLIAKRQIEIARMENADAVSHGSTGKGNDQVRFELTYYAFEPNIKIIAPWREWSFASREELIDYAQKHGIDVPVSKAKPYSMDRNLMHISYEGGILEDPWMEANEDMFLTTVSPEKAPDTPRYIEIDFEEGTPVRIDGRPMSPFEIVAFLNKAGGENGVGRFDIVENRFVGMKSRGVYETPGCTVLHAAHRAMESITMDREVMHMRDSLVPKIAELIYYGFWYSPEMAALKAFVDETQKNVTGTVRMKLYKGNCVATGRRSDRSLYMKDFATFDKDAVYDQRDAGGFIRLNALRLRIRAMLNR